MNSTKRLEVSLARTRIQKLIVCLGYADKRSLDCRGAVATRVAQSLLHRCMPAPSDIHDPDSNRLHGRDAKGRARRSYAAYTDCIATKGKGKRGVASGSEALRNPQTWDSDRVPDYMGLWCDRLLLGDFQEPSRTALLVPHVPYSFQAESIERVARAHRHLSRANVLFVRAAPDLPFGIVRQSTSDTLQGRAKEDEGCSRSRSAVAARIPEDALSQFTPPGPHNTLSIGVGDAVGPRATFTGEEEARLRHHLVPLTVFTAALWTVNPTKSADYVAAVTPTPGYLQDQTANLRLWRTMQESMLSTRDCALLSAHFSGTPLDARLSPMQEQYLAETLLRRLQDSDRGCPM